VRVQLWVVLLLAFALASAPAFASEPISVAMLPIVVHSASNESDYLSKGLVDMLSARLEQGGGIRVIRVESNARAANPDVAVEAGRAAGAEFVVFGSFTQFGAGASLDVRCARVADGGEGGESSQPREVFVQSGALGEIIPRLDDLAGRIAKYVKGGGVAAPPEVSQGAVAPAAAGAAGDLEGRVEALERAVFGERKTGAKE